MSANPDIINLAYASALAFLIGAIPTAYLGARIHGVNIFNVGSRQAGATNVWKSVNRKTGFLVFLIDVAKGVIIIQVSRYVFEVTGLWLMLPSIAVILGHWFSPATKFKGGDGVASLGGIAVGIFQWAALPASLVAIVFGLPPLRYKFAHPSLQAGVFGWTVLLLTIAMTVSSEQRVEALLLYVGVSLLALAVLFKSVRFHKRNAELFSEEDEVGAGEFEDQRPANSES